MFLILCLKSATMRTTDFTHTVVTQKFFGHFKNIYYYILYNNNNLSIISTRFKQN